MQVINNLNEAASSADLRGCLMLSLPDDISNAIKAWGSNKISKEELTYSGFENYIHCTVLYGFSQATKFEKVKAFLEDECELTNTKKLNISLGEVKRFSCEDFDVIHVAVENCMPLYKLHFALKDKFQVTTSYPTYNPHVTIAYVKKGACAELDGSKLFMNINVLCDQITYSTGPPEKRTRKEINYESFKERIRSSKTLSI